MLVIQFNLISGAGSSVFDRSTSLYQIQDSVDGPMPITKPLKARNKSLGSMEIIEPGGAGGEAHGVYYINGKWNIKTVSIKDLGHFQSPQKEFEIKTNKNK